MVGGAGSGYTDPVSLVPHATVAAFAAALPIPLLDDVLGRLARGSALRRVAKGHGVALRPDARQRLAEAAPPLLQALPGGGITRRVLVRVATPLRVWGRAEAGVVAMLDARLLDHYLAIAPERGWREAGAPLALVEAESLLAAMKAAREGGLPRSLLAFPVRFAASLSDLPSTLRGDDDEGRNRVERAMDTLLDAFADAPPGAWEAVTARFERALEAAPPLQVPDRVVDVEAV
ncbi:MAG: hypothetical protein AAF447_01855 [Myxococcota bacterium]